MRVVLDLNFFAGDQVEGSACWDDAPQLVEFRGWLELLSLLSPLGEAPVGTRPSEHGGAA
jgi:hypothetical protein